MKNEKIFSILGPNKTDITFSGNGKSPWTLLIGNKGVRKQIHLLLIGQRIWGIELDMGIKMRSNANKLGNERLITFLTNQVNSMLDDESSWDTVEVFCKD